MQVLHKMQIASETPARVGTRGSWWRTESGCPGRRAGLDQLYGGIQMVKRVLHVLEELIQSGNEDWRCRATLQQVLDPPQCPANDGHGEEGQGRKD